jgi:membrane associated rhomboid family serine protease
MSKLRDRPTSDLIVMFLAGVIALVILTALIGGVVWRINDPNADLDGLVKWVGDLTGTLVGAVVGYLAGKGAGAEQASMNAAHQPPTEE